MAKNEPTKQHYVPQCYLKPFAAPSTINDKEPFIWIFPRNVRSGRIDKIKNVLFVNDLYTLNIDGRKNYSIEKSLSKIEGEYTSLYQNKIAKRLPLSKKEHEAFCIFIGVLMQRTLRHKNALEEFLTEVVEKMEKLDEARNTKSKIVENYKSFKKDSHKLGILGVLPDIADVLIKMNLAFLCTDDSNPGYITCDDPCVMFNPDMQWNKFYGYGLAQKSIKLSITLSPNTLVVFSWQNLRGYIKTSNSRVQEHNRMIQHHSYRYFLLNSPKTKLMWFSKYRLSLSFFIKVMRYKLGKFIFRMKYLWKMKY